MMWLEAMRRLRSVKLYLLLLLIFASLAPTTLSFAQDPVQRLVRRFEMPELGVANPAGLAYSPEANALLVAPAPETELLSVFTFAPEESGLAQLPATMADPVNMVFDGGFNSLLFWDAGANELVEIAAAEGGLPDADPEAVSRFDGSLLGVVGPQGMTIDPATGNLFFLIDAGLPGEQLILRVTPDPGDRFDGHTARRDGRLRLIEVPDVPSNALRGIAFNPNDANLYLVGPAERMLYGISQSGELLSTHSLSSFDDLGASELTSIQNITFAPSGDQTDDPDIMNLYVADDGLESDLGQGDIFEIALAEPPQYTLQRFSVNDVAARESAEGAVHAVFTVALSGPSELEALVDYGTEDGTAVAASDYVASFGTLVFAPGETSKEVAVEILDDEIVEGEESFSLTLRNARGFVTIDDGEGVATIEDDESGIGDGGSAISISIDDVVVDEAVGTVTFNVRLSGANEEDVIVDFATADGTAVANIDYTPASGTLTIPAGSVSGSITFGNIGDFGSDTEREAAVADMLLAMNPDFITTNGDNNYPDGEVETWDENVLQYYGDYVDADDVNANRFFATLGNHDYHVYPEAFLEGLALPEGQGNERYYDFVKGPVHFFAIDSNSEQPDGRESDSIQAEWLKEKMTQSTAIWKVVYMHHAPWSSGDNHGSKDEVQWPYDEWGADAVFAGHDHLYERISKDEDGDGEPILYFVNGIGGKSPYDFGSPIEGSEFRYNDDNGAMFVTANNTSMTFEFHSVSDGLVDQFIVSKPGKASALASTIEASITDDNEEESEETFRIVLSNPVNAALSDGEGTATIMDNDGPRPITVSFQEGVGGYNGARDTKLMSDEPVSNYGDDDELEVDGSPGESALLFWDLTSIPTQSIVESVDITLNVTNSSDESYGIYEVKRAWNENEASWNEAGSGESWQEAGARGANDKGSSVLGTISNWDDGSRTVSLGPEGIAVVQEWVNNPALNHGLIILDDEGASDGLDFSSNEVETASDRPKMTVTYSAVSQTSVDEPEVPGGYQLDQNFPNPFNPTTRISYTMPEAGFVTLKVYDLLGKEIQTLVNEFQPAGSQTFEFDASRLSSGTYFYTVRIGGSFVKTKTMLLLK